MIRVPATGWGTSQRRTVAALTKFDKSKCQHRQEVGRKPVLAELAISGCGAAKEFGLCEEASRSFQFFRAAHATLVIDESYQENGVIF